MTFLLIAVFMVCAAAACLLWPLLRRRPGSSGAPAAVLAAHKRKLTRLDAQLANGELLMPAYLQARAAVESEVQARLEKLAPVTAPVPAGKPRWVTALVASLVLVALAGGVYISIGNWHAAVFGAQQASQSSVEQMVAGLARRLQTRDANDAAGWAMLGRSYVVLGRYPDAESAYAHAYALSGDHDAELLADYAEALVLADPARLTTAAAPLLEKALQAEPDNPKALWYGGLLAQAHHDPKLAAQRWQKILSGDPPPGIREFVQQHLAELSGAVSAAPVSGARKQ